jgi:hypothetical protein
MWAICSTTCGGTSGCGGAGGALEGASPDDELDRSRASCAAFPGPPCTHQTHRHLITLRIARHRSCTAAMHVDCHAMNLFVATVLRTTPGAVQHHPISPGHPLHKQDQSRCRRWASMTSSSGGMTPYEDARQQRRMWPGTWTVWPD